jgi:hypothetical protein
VAWKVPESSVRRSKETLPQELRVRPRSRAVVKCVGTAGKIAAGTRA